MSSKTSKFDFLMLHIHVYCSLSLGLLKDRKQTWASDGKARVVRPFEGGSHRNGTVSSFPSSPKVGQSRDVGSLSYPCVLDDSELCLTSYCPSMRIISAELTSPALRSAHLLNSMPHTGS
jgi:hypothetical protein